MSGTVSGGRCAGVWGKDPFVTAENALRGRKLVPDTFSSPIQPDPRDLLTTDALTPVAPLIASTDDLQVRQSPLEASDSRIGNGRVT